MKRPGPSNEGPGLSSGRRTHPIAGFNFETGAQLGSIVIVPGNFGNALMAQIGKKADHGFSLALIEEIFIDAHLFDLLTFDKEETESATIVPHNMRTDHFKGPTLIPNARGSDQAMIAKPGKTTFNMPLINSGKHLKRVHMGKLPGFDGSAVQNHLNNGILSLPLQDHVSPF